VDDHLLGPGWPHDERLEVGGAEPEQEPHQAVGVGPAALAETCKPRRGDAGLGGDVAEVHARGAAFAVDGGVERFGVEVCSAHARPAVWRAAAQRSAICW